MKVTLIGPNVTVVVSADRGGYSPDVMHDIAQRAVEMYTAAEQQVVLESAVSDATPDA